MKSSTRAFIAFLLILLHASAFGADENLVHGIRNKKCAASEEEAKLQLFEELRMDKSLCKSNGFPNQVAGWSCHHGGDCPKAAVRCNTQYQCGRAPIETPTPTAVASPISPSPTVPKMPMAKPNTSVSPIPPSTPVITPLSTPTKPAS